MPTVSPDGSQLMAVSLNPDHSELWLMQADGSAPHRWKICAKWCWAPRWSPDGSRIAYSLHLGDLSGVWPVAWSPLTDSSQFVIAVPSTYVGDGPAWSPDGQRLLAARWDGNGYHLYVVGISGAGLTRVTDDAYPGTPAWMP